MTVYKMLHSFYGHKPQESLNLTGSVINKIVNIVIFSGQSKHAK